jgi:hypothetical protein
MKMPEDSDEEAAKAFGVIPYLFFDLIARVAPGLLLLFGLDHVNGRHIIPALLDIALPSPKLQESPIAWLAIVLSAGYILGHAMSPIVKLLDKTDKVTSLKYNSLRLNFPGVTSIAMRIRAEYIMYAGFAVALAIMLLLTVVYEITGLHPWYSTASANERLDGWMLFAVALLGIPLMIYRNQRTIKTFRETTANLYAASGLPEPVPRQDEAPPSIASPARRELIPEAHKNAEKLKSE